MTDNEILTVPVCCDKVPTAACLPITSGEPDWVPELDQLPIAYDPDTCTTWYYQCEPEPAGWRTCGGVVIIAPVAVNDQSIGNVLGTEITLSVLSNDVAGTELIDFTCVSLIPTGTAINIVTDIDGLVRSYDEPAQGSWSVDIINGDVTFTPVNNTNAGPFTARYTMCDINGLVSNEAIISVQYIACSSQLYGDVQDTLNVALATGEAPTALDVAKIDLSTGVSTVLASAVGVSFNAIGADKVSGDAFMIDKITGDLWRFTYSVDGLVNIGNALSPAQALTTVLGAYSFADDKHYVANVLSTTGIDVFSINVNTLVVNAVPGISISLGGLDSGGGTGFDFDFDISGRLWMQFGLNIYYADPPFNVGWTLFHDLSVNGLTDVSGGFGVQAGVLNGQNSVTGQLYSLEIATKVFTIGPVMAFDMSDFTNLPIEVCVPFIRTTCDDGSVEDTLQDGVTPYVPSGDLLIGGCS